MHRERTEGRNVKHQTDKKEHPPEAMVNQKGYFKNYLGKVIPGDGFSLIRYDFLEGSRAKNHTLVFLLA